MVNGRKPQKNPVKPRTYRIVMKGIISLGDDVDALQVFMIGSSLG